VSAAGIFFTPETAGTSDAAAGAIDAESAPVIENGLQNIGQDLSELTGGGALDSATDLLGNTDEAAINGSGMQGLLDSSGNFGMKIPEGTTKEDLVNALQQAGWTETAAQGGAKSGTGQIFTDPQTGDTVRVMTRPDGTSYARMQNFSGNYLTSDGSIPKAPRGQTLSSQEVRNLTHFNLK
jgi:hypothetical protein